MVAKSNVERRTEARALSTPPAPLPAFAVGAILLAEGYASLAAEILALRRMVPFAGSAVSVTALLLAVYLAALAGGYRRGGRPGALRRPAGAPRYGWRQPQHWQPSG